eukprot:jgi/Tetstr1/445381/TSEL_003394.t1
MSRLEELILRLAAKKGLQVADEDSESSDGSTPRSEGAGKSSGGCVTTACSKSLYRSRQYWEDRYADGVVGHSEAKGVLSNEWYFTYQALSSQLSSHINKDDRVLLLGCGLSTLGVDMEAEGYSSIVAIDYSETCIQRMNDSRGPSSSVQYMVMDVTCLDFEKGSIDCVLDKATLDSLMNEDEPSGVVCAMLREACRVLRPGGKYVCISHSDRRKLLTDRGLSWALTAEVPLAKKQAEFWMYVLTKRGA